MGAASGSERAAARAGLETQRLQLAALVRRVTSAGSAVHAVASDEGWSGTAKWAFDLSIQVLGAELAHASDALRSAERLTEAALYEIERGV